jgi:uracil-DNA glycosylase family 4
MNPMPTSHSRPQADARGDDAAQRDMSTSEALTVLNDHIVTCTRCPRLAAYREEAAQTPRRAFAGQTYWARPVPSIGDPEASVMIVGLAPAAHGSNRTGRMFTGDGTDGMGAGDFLMRALHALGFASQPSSRHPGDGLTFHDLYVTAAVRCAPPENKPSPEEVANCRSFLLSEIALLPRLRVIVALGKLAFDQIVKLYAAQGITQNPARPKFGHGVVVDPGAGLPVLIGSYHPSRQNTQTGLLSQAMLQDVFRTARSLAETGTVREREEDVRE